MSGIAVAICGLVVGTAAALFYARVTRRYDSAGAVLFVIASLVVALSYAA